MMGELGSGSIGAGGNVKTIHVQQRLLHVTYNGLFYRSVTILVSI